MPIIRMSKMANTATIKQTIGHLGLHSPVATMQLLDMSHSAKTLQSNRFQTQARPMYLKNYEIDGIIVLISHKPTFPKWRAA
jgi:hypothetical protein